MENLVEKFKDIVMDHTNIAQEVDAYEVAPLIAEEARKIAIEFAKSLMGSEISTHRSDKIGETSKEVTKYTPPEYPLMKGELIMNGDNLFNYFIDNYYEKIKS